MSPSAEKKKRKWHNSIVNRKRQSLYIISFCPFLLAFFLHNLFVQKFKLFLLPVGRRDNFVSFFCFERCSSRQVKVISCCAAEKQMTFKQKYTDIGVVVVGIDVVSSTYISLDVTDAVATATSLRHRWYKISIKKKWDIRSLFRHKHKLNGCGVYPEGKQNKNKRDKKVCNKNKRYTNS